MGGSGRAGIHCYNTHSTVIYWCGIVWCGVVWCGVLCVVCGVWCVVCGVVWITLANTSTLCCHCHLLIPTYPSSPGGLNIRIAYIRVCMCSLQADYHHHRLFVLTKWCWRRKRRRRRRRNTQEHIGRTNSTRPTGFIFLNKKQNIIKTFKKHQKTIIILLETIEDNNKQRNQEIIVLYA